MFVAECSSNTFIRHNLWIIFNKNENNLQFKVGNKVQIGGVRWYNEETELFFVRGLSIIFRHFGKESVVQIAKIKNKEFKFVVFENRRLLIDWLRVDFSGLGNDWKNWRDL